MKNILIDPAEIKLTFISSPGPGGQKVNKAATAAQLRFNVVQSASLTDEIRTRLLVLLGKKITQQGDLIIKASRYRTQLQNKQDALERLNRLIQKAAKPCKIRKKTRPPLAAKERRLTQKKLQGAVKSLRRPYPLDEDS